MNTIQEQLEASNTYYETKLAQGQSFQQYVTQWFAEQGVVFQDYTTKQEQLEKGENTLGMEIKRDGRFRETGNLYIETEEKSSSVLNLHWAPSGIFRDDQSWLFCIGDESTFWIFAKKDLQRWSQCGRYEKKQIVTSRGFVMPVTDADKYCARKVEVYF